MLDVLETLALAAGKEILSVYNAGPNVTFKDDASPVTEADDLDLGHAKLPAGLHIAAWSR